MTAKLFDGQFSLETSLDPKLFKWIEGPFMLNQLKEKRSLSLSQYWSMKSYQRIYYSYQFKFTELKYKINKSTLSFSFNLSIQGLNFYQDLSFLTGQINVILKN